VIATTKNGVFSFRVSARSQLARLRWRACEAERFFARDSHCETWSRSPHGELQYEFYGVAHATEIEGLAARHDVNSKPPWAFVSPVVQDEENASAAARSRKNKINKP
jgi:hypothetical protein